MSLVGDQGAQVYQTLLSRAQSLRVALRTNEQQRAATATTLLYIPTSLLLLVFLVLIGYPATHPDRRTGTPPEETMFSYARRSWPTCGVQRWQALREDEGASTIEYTLLVLLGIAVAGLAILAITDGGHQQGRPTIRQRHRDSAPQVTHRRFAAASRACRARLVAPAGGRPWLGHPGVRDPRTGDVLAHLRLRPGRACTRSPGRSR